MTDLEHSSSDRGLAGATSPAQPETTDKSSGAGTPPAPGTGYTSSYRDEIMDGWPWWQRAWLWLRSKL